MLWTTWAETEGGVDEAYALSRHGQSWKTSEYILCKRLAGRNIWNTPRSWLLLCSILQQRRYFRDLDLGRGFRKPVSLMSIMLMIHVYRKSVKNKQKPYIISRIRRGSMRTNPQNCTRKQTDLGSQVPSCFARINRCWVEPILITGHIVRLSLKITWCT